MSKTISVNGLSVITGALLFLGAGPVWAENPHAYRGYSGTAWVSPPPSYFGYNLDEHAAGYYGGGRYREYYSFGRGYGLADYPGPFAGPGVPPDYRGLWNLYPPMAHPPVHVEGLAPTAPQKTTVSLRLKVPADAAVWLDGAKTAQTGADRLFESPPIKPGAPYTYAIRARWTENGRSVEQTQIVLVRAGDQIAVSFPTFPETIPAPAKLPLTAAQGGKLPPPSHALETGETSRSTDR